MCNVPDVSTQLTGLLFLILFISVAWVFGKSYHSNYNKKMSFYEKPIEPESFLIYVSFADHTSSFGGATVTLRKQITSHEDI